MSSWHWEDQRAKTQRVLRLLRDQPTRSIAATCRDLGLPRPTFYAQASKFFTEQWQEVRALRGANPQKGRSK